MENPIKMDDLGVPLFLETSIYHQERIDGDRHSHVLHIATFWGWTPAIYGLSMRCVALKMGFLV